MPGAAGGPCLVLDELSRERLAEGRQLLAEIVSEHGRLQQDGGAEVLGRREGLEVSGAALRAYQEWDPAGGFSPLGAEQQRCLMFA